MKTFDTQAQKWKEIDNKTINKHVSRWLMFAIPLNEFPTRMLIDFYRDRVGILDWLRAYLLGKAISNLEPYVTKQPPGTTFDKFLDDLEKSPQDLNKLEKTFKKDPDVQWALKSIEQIKIIQTNPVGRELLKKEFPTFVKMIHGRQA